MLLKGILLIKKNWSQKSIKNTKKKINNDNHKKNNIIVNNKNHKSKRDDIKWKNK